MKRMFLLTTLLITGTLIFSQPAEDKFMPVTTNSKSALSLYNQAMRLKHLKKLLMRIRIFSWLITRWLHITF
jgi:hypothetical protein